MLFTTFHRTRAASPKYLFGLLAVVLLSAGVNAQGTVSLSGFVRDGGSGEALPSGYVYAANSGRGADLNEYGYYQLLLPTGEGRLIVGAVGYLTDTIALNLTDNRRLDLTLQPLDMATIVVTARRARPPQPGRETVAAERLRNVPALFGEPDPIRALQILPGVSGGVDRQVGLNVRGGSSDQNLLLMDGATVYNSGHLFGFLSVFNPAIVNSVDVYKGYVPGRYNGRASSVIDVSVREGSRDRHRKTASFGLINSSLLFEGPLNKQQTASYLVAGRLAHTVAPSTIYSIIKPGNQSLLAGMYDFNAKLSWDLPREARLTLSAYAGDDIVRGSSSFDGTDEFGNIDYGNRTVSGRYFRPLGERLSLASNVVFNRYSSGLTVGSDDRSIGSSVRFRNRNNITEVKADQQLTYRFNRGEIRGGLTATHRNMEPVHISIEENGARTETGRINYYPFLYSAYLESEWQFGSRYSLTADLHRSQYHLGGADDYSFGAWEPRVAVGVQLGKRFGLNAGYSRLVQNVHQTLTVGIDASFENWLPIVADLPEQGSHQFSVGTNWQPTKQLSIGAEVYYKTLRGQVSTPGFGYTFNGVETADWSGQLLGGGEGTAYGLELQAHYQRGAFDVDIAYTYSRSLRSFRELNDGEQFPFRFDRPHDLSLNALWRPSKRWSVSTNFVLQSGAAYTLPAAFIQDVTGRPSPIYLTRNNARLPLYHRLDLTVSKHFRTKRKGREGRLDFSLYNAYSRQNASFVQPDEDFDFGPDFGGELRSVQLNFRRGSVFPVLPSINYSLKW